jgi:hypothetical protein
MKRELILSVGLLVLAFTPLLVCGEQGYIDVFDNLDSEFVYLHLLKQNGLLFSYSDGSVVDQVFNGLSTKFYHSEFSFIRVLFHLLPSFWAYVVNSLLVRFIGLLGVFFLLRDYFQVRSWPAYLVVILLLSFSLLPIYSLYGLSVMGQPLLLWSFLNLKNRRNVFWSLLFIAVFPFYSHFAMIAPFAIVSFVCLMLWFLRVERRVVYPFVIGISLLTLCFVLANYLTISNFLWGTELTHRSEWIIESPGLLSIIRTFFMTLFFGQMHSAVLFSLPLCVGFVLFYKAFLARKTLILVLIGSVVSIAFFYAIYPFLAMSSRSFLNILTTFQFSRFTFLLPFLAYLLAFAFLSDLESRQSPIRRRVLISLLLLFSIVNIAGNKEVVNNWYSFATGNEKNATDPTFHFFFAPDLFSEVKDCIPASADEYRVVCLGFHPSVAQYAGFYTLDSYQNNYPLAYKHRFRKIIEPELLKSPSLKSYFDYWGNRCYMLSSELNFRFDTRNAGSIVLKDFDFDHVALKSMGCSYILSSVEILDYESKGLKVFKEIGYSNYPYRIIVYSL